MDELAFWQQKIVQFFHDPPGKPYRSYGKREWFEKLVDELFEEKRAEEKGADHKLQSHRRAGLKGHKRVAAALIEAHTGVPFRYVIGAPDWCASGADRPMLSAPEWGKRVDVRWEGRRILTHPLSPEMRLEVPPPSTGEEPTSLETTRQLIRLQLETAGGEPLTDGKWKHVDSLHVAFVTLWRRFRDDLVARASGDGVVPGSYPLWEEMPADSRCPDHSIWDHLKVTTALAFLKRHKMTEGAWVKGSWVEGPRQPCLLRFSIGPAQAFIAEARTSRDLWTGSMLLTELAWAAMLPFVERYGPDCVIYPDLRGNPRVDGWLAVEHPNALRPDTEASTFAAMLPNSFVVVAPRGGEGHLQDLTALADEAVARVGKRWRALAGLVRDWLAGVRGGPGAGPDGRETIFNRQTENPPIHCTWTAIPWLPVGCIEDPTSDLGRALPAQAAGFREPADPAKAARDRETLAKRAARLRPWVPAEVWARYESARRTFAAAHLDFHQMERGFDYALTHHQLSVRHALGKQSYPVTPGQHAEEPGEKCTLCHKRQALTNADSTAGDLDGLRQAARTFWKAKPLDPDGRGSDRLCGVCAVKRFLVAADQGPKSFLFNDVWMRADEGQPERIDRDGKQRVPFPSTATVAAQRFIEAVLADPGLRPQVEALHGACGRARLPATSFPRALPRLAALARRHDGAAPGRLLEYEAETLFFPDAVEGEARGIEERNRGAASGSTQGADGPSVDALRGVAGASRALLSAARRRWTEDDRGRPASERRPLVPGTQVAVIRMDGDHMGRLLLGDPESIPTRWRDVIHPDGVEQLKGKTDLLAAGWADLIDAPRLMGPSLHAFVSRALGNFSHRVVPWVVEREFSGRLIYAGGDDLLCLAPAEEALDLAARLQQLFSAAWVLDTDPEAAAGAWGWRRGDWAGPYDQKRARLRFAIPRAAPDDGAIRLPVEPRDLEPHVADDVRHLEPVAGPLLPMLGQGASLSAGIAIGHYKTPLSGLLQRSKALLDLAKNPYRGRQAPPGAWAGRRGVAIGHASRGGEKTGFAMPWDGADGVAGAHRCLDDIVDGFATGRLSSRLPYKLRGYARSLHAALTTPEADGDGRREELLTGLLCSAMTPSPLLENARGREPGGSARRAVDLKPDARAILAVWDQGIRLHGDQPDRYTDGLLLCRALAGFTGEEEA